MRKIALIVIIGIAFSSCNQSKKNNDNPKSESQTVRDSLTAELDSIQKSGLINGFAVAMVNQNGVLYEKGFGYSNRETKEEYTENTIQHIASVSKTLIGISLMKAQEIGKLKLDDPIHNYLPFEVINPNYPNERITIRQLATHTSGINDTEQYMQKAWILTKNQDLTDVSTDYPAQRLNSSEFNIPMEEYLKGYLEINGTFYQGDNYLNFKPGERYNYSNIGATLCALVIEKATGKTFDSFTKEHILKPLGMNSTGWSLKDVNIKKHSRLYRNDNTLLPFYTAITYPDGMLISSSSDMAKYLAELVKGYCGEGTLLSKNSYKELFTEQLEEENFESRNASNPYNGDYSPAIFIGHSALGYVGHSGGDAGVGTWMYFDKEKKTGRYIVINTDMGNDERSKELEYYAIWDKMNEYFDRLSVEQPTHNNSYAQ
ncbi:CubicO group peptidase (beta-lactamase class C family) [Aquimarina sp. EL_43]|uniref:serine hydrolase domain-containing protein n=1 Tax=unclassified Aquimarina TaxID=2627091 RepID=UPI0018C987EB|nr:MULTISPECIES: serine hydrolase domain-containing protein [unclassified Aquimarina]MBG6129156.1 CubicO group peptidase (beta-lactamase class C family) [Aquimarina sp. EL_35]MBG6150221.1 CubicO group peptidase (beta-lactamase class C family) [Aquimarina sp. EL_32]MBG6167094.1 CubicO group peptidase (beta-lactamase class C family) [Aquimarina sp. EL_43]